MADFVKVASKNDLASGEGMVVEVGGNRIALFNLNGEFCALDNTCPHRGGPLGEGMVDTSNMTVQCPWHGWVFNCRTGVSPVNPSARVEAFEVKVEGDDVLVALN
jgi:nitrite reductase (NADH) small subunit